MARAHLRPQPEFAPKSNPIDLRMGPVATIDLEALIVAPELRSLVDQGMMKVVSGHARPMQVK